MNRAIKYKVYPTTEQSVMFTKTFGCCRKVWNLMLADKINFYKENGKILQTTPAKYKKDFDFLKEIDSLALAKEQRKLSRKVGSLKGEIKSNNYLKQLKKVNKIHRHISNQRLDNLHKLSTVIANQYDIVCVEDLNMKSLANNHYHNGKATYDNGYGLFLNLLEYKLNDRGKYFIKIDKWYPSSQICINCGNKHKLLLKDRVYKCDCGFVLDRDLNAAINIKKEGLRLLKIA